MATLSREQVLHIARLCRLELSEEETELYTSQLSSILDYVDKLAEVDTAGVEVTNQVTEQTNIAREDVVSDTDQTLPKRLLDLAPEREGDGYKVPPVF